jgi:hypothetical protein
LIRQYVGVNREDVVLRVRAVADGLATRAVFGDLGAVDWGLPSLEDELAVLTSETGFSQEEIYDEIALALAEGFNVDRWSYDFCDRVVNDLYGMRISAGNIDFPDRFWEVFKAFDEGEYHHSGDNRAVVDPVEKYTRPLIGEFLRKARDEGS